MKEKKSKVVDKEQFRQVLAEEEFLSSDKHMLVVGIVNRGFASAAVAAARENGGSGAVILEGRGVSKSERKFFGVIVEPENEMILMVVKEEFVYPVIKSIYGTVDYKSPGRGLVFALPVSVVSGLTHGIGQKKEDDK